ncbi:MAG: Beta-galactosidase trimerization domain protein [Clostridia bacterium]|jgi:hypothetical protein|nr:Beta-galactosidase trimerization domain protein [Clostridia bacterium]
MKDYKLRFRQVHMDFHTSEKISGIGEKFDADEFAGTLDEARVNSVTCFARCHHGWLYYDSKNYPEMIHPGLKQKDLLEQQIKACHKRNIRVPVYTTVQWDHFTSSRHPEWVCINEDGTMVDTCNPESKGVYEAGFYKTLCVNTSYRDYLKAHIKDIFESVPEVDGIFLDIVMVVDCSCRTCVEGMLKENYDPVSREERLLYAKKMMEEFKKDISDYIRSFNSAASIFYNTSHIEPALRTVQDSYTHWELESLPSGGWGYVHFPNSARFARTTGLDLLGQTGKFHTMWGDFHSFKNKEALEYECYRMLAFNAKCMIGDQLDPDGKISKDVYQLIGSVYKEVEQKEPWCIEARPVCDMAIFTPEALGFNSGCGGTIPESVVGASTMLEEMGHQFDIVDVKSDFNSYKVIILPDEIIMNKELAEKVENYIEAGGSVIATYQSGLNSEKTAFASGVFGVNYLGEAPYSPDFIVPKGEIGKGLSETEYVMYKQGTHIEITEGTELLSSVNVPYFNRTWQHFCSHKHTPSSHQYGYPGIVKKGKVIYYSHPVFSTYAQLHPKWCKLLIKNGLDMLLPEPIVRYEGPTSLLACVNLQEQEKRYVLHMLHYIPEKRCQEIFTIEDVIPLYYTKVSMKLSEKAKAVKVVPDGENLDFKYHDGRIQFVIEKINGHAMVAIEY